MINVITVTDYGHYSCGHGYYCIYFVLNKYYYIIILYGGSHASDILHVLMGVSVAKLIIYNIVLLFICHNKRSSSSSSSSIILSSRTREDLACYLFLTMCVQLRFNYIRWIFHTRRPTCHANTATYEKLQKRSRHCFAGVGVEES